jgi:hypothetical protein
VGNACQDLHGKYPRGCRIAMALGMYGSSTASDREVLSNLNDAVSAVRILQKVDQAAEEQDPLREAPDGPPAPELHPDTNLVQPPVPPSDDAGSLGDFFDFLFEALGL